jgi:hypothetical protein
MRIHRRFVRRAHRSHGPLNESHHEGAHAHVRDPPSGRAHRRLDGDELQGRCLRRQLDVLCRPCGGPRARPSDGGDREDARLDLAADRDGPPRLPRRRVRFLRPSARAAERRRRGGPCAGLALRSPEVLAPKISCRRSLYHDAISRKARTVAGALPGSVGRVPADDAAEMSTAC